MKNCPSHRLNDEVSEFLKIINTVVQKLSPNATDLFQPVDSFIIQKIKKVWRRRLDDHKMDFVRRELWEDGYNGN